MVRIPLEVSWQPRGSGWTETCGTEQRLWHRWWQSAIRSFVMPWDTTSLPKTFSAWRSAVASPSSKVGAPTLAFLPMGQALRPRWATWGTSNTTKSLGKAKSSVDPKGAPGYEVDEQALTTTQEHHRGSPSYSEAIPGLLLVALTVTALLGYLSWAWALLLAFVVVVSRQIAIRRHARRLDLVRAWRFLYRVDRRRTLQTYFVRSGRLVTGTKGREGCVLAGYTENGVSVVLLDARHTHGSAVVTALHEWAHVERSDGRHDAGFAGTFQALTLRAGCPARLPNGRVNRALIDVFEATVVDWFDDATQVAPTVRVVWRRRATYKGAAR